MFDSYYGSGFPAIGPWMGGYGLAEQPVDPNRKPMRGQNSGPQTLLPGALGAWQGTTSQMLSFVQGGVDRFTYEPPRRYSFATYRLIMRQATCSMLYESKVNKILASSWTVRSRRKDKPATAQALALVEDCLLPQRLNILEQGLRFLWSGFRPFEKVWSNQNGTPYWLDLKPLLPDWTIIYRTPDGMYSGIKSYPKPVDDATMLKEAQDDPDGILGPHKSLLLTNNGEGTNFYGSSRCDTLYDPFVAWNTSRMKLMQSMMKMSGSIIKIFYPQGQGELNGVMVDNSVIADKAGQSLTNGNSYFTIPMGPEFGTGVMTDKGIETLWNIEIENTSGYAEGIKAVLDDVAYLDKQFCRAFGTPERAIIEASKAGSRADSGEASDVAVDDLEAIEDRICNQLNRGGYGNCGAVDDLILFNRGASEVGSVVIEPNPLVDMKRQLQKDLFVSMMNGSSEQALEAWERLDKTQWFDDLEMPTDPDFDIVKFQAKVQKMRQQKSGMPGLSNSNPLDQSTTTVK